MLRHAFSLAIVAGFACSAWADLPPPPPERGFKRVPYEQVMKLDKELPGYKFYAFQRLGLGGDETIKQELNLGTEAGVAVPSSSSPSVRTGVVAVPAMVMDELKTKENLAKLLSRENKEPLPAGVVVYETRGTISDIKESDPRTKVETVITVSADEKAGVKFTPKETPAPPGKNASSDASSDTPITTIAAGVAGALAFVALGLWFFRRKSE